MDYEEAELAAIMIDRQRRFEDFTAALTNLSMQYGIALNATGGVYFAHNVEEFATLSYSQDSTSGDLRFEC